MTSQGAKIGQNLTKGKNKIIYHQRVQVTGRMLQFTASFYLYFQTAWEGVESTPPGRAKV